ncbi:MAG: hypothetical protein K2J00_05695 [Bacteroidaceae bacterium]|nr:hypothetical protein [Bacteroidaceae bacterium]
MFPTCCLVGVLTLFLAACSKDDDSDESGMSDGTPKELIGTWDMDETTSITFNKNGSGVFKTSDFDDDDDDDGAYSRLIVQAKSEAATRANNSALITISFKWKYSSNPPMLKITLQGETMVWYIESISESSLTITDEDGITFTMQKNTGNTPVTPETPYKIGSKELLYGDWGVAGTKIYGFTKNGVFLWHHLDGSAPETGEYTYNEETHALRIYDGGWSAYEIIALTPTVIGITREEWEEWEGRLKKYTTFYSRINENEENTIGPISLIYDKKMFVTGVKGYDHEYTHIMTITFKSNGKYTMTIDGQSATANYVYDESTHKLIMSAYGGTSVLNIIKLTENCIITETEIVDEDGNSKKQRIEYVAI